MDEPVHLQGVGPVVDAREGVAVDLADRLVQFDRIPQGGVEVRDDQDVADSGEQLPGDRLRCEKGTELQKPQGCGVAVREPVQRDVPGRGNRPVVVHRRVGVQQLVELLLEQPQVLLRLHPGLRAPGCGLFDGQRQITQSLGQAARVDVGELRPAPLQQFDAFLPGEHVDFQRSRDVGPLHIAGRDEHPAAATSGEEPADGFRVLRVIKNQQPPAVGNASPQRLQHGGDGDIRLRSDREAKPLGEVDERRADLRGPFRGDPPDNVVIRLLTVDVLHGQLRLADTAHAVQRLGEDGGRPFVEPRVQLGEQRATAREVGVPRGYVPPYRRRPPGALQLHRWRRGNRRHRSSFVTISRVVRLLGGGGGLAERCRAGQRSRHVGAITHSHVLNIIRIRSGLVDAVGDQSGAGQITAGDRRQDGFLDRQEWPVGLGDRRDRYPVGLVQHAVGVPQHTDLWPQQIAYCPQDTDSLGAPAKSQQLRPYPGVELQRDPLRTAGIGGGRRPDHPAREDLGQLRAAGPRHHLLNHPHHRPGQRRRGQMGGQVESRRGHRSPKPLHTFRSRWFAVLLPGVRVMIRRPTPWAGEQGQQIRPPLPAG